MKSLQRSWGFRRFLSTICYHTDSILLTQNHGEKMLINDNMTGRIINACFEVHNELGNGFLETVYQEALEGEFKIQEIPYEREKLLPIIYKGKRLSKEYYADFVCYDSIIVELKAVTVLSKPHKAQVLNYLNAANLDIGLLINFGETSLKWERITKFKNKENR